MAKAVEIIVSDRQRTILEKWRRNKAGTSYRLIERCKFILKSAEGLSNIEQARRFGVDRQRIRRSAPSS